MLRAFIFVILYLTRFKTVESGTNYIANDPGQSLLLRNNERGLTDIWNSIKVTIRNAWNAIKDMAEKTKHKIDKWIGRIKDQARDIFEKFNERLSNIREKSKKLFDEIMSSDAVQLVKECFSKQNEDVEKLLQQISTYVTSCISDSISTFSRNDYLQNNFGLNESEFIKRIENKMDQCKNRTDAEQCLYIVREDLFSEMNTIENDILKHGVESKGMAIDLLDTVASCSIGGLIDASNVIATEVFHMISCLLQG